MAFLRFTRDKRGYEHFSLVEPTTNRRGKVRQRVLYWFRSPPDVKVGREPFDEGVRRALEAQNPDVTFDWRSILEAPIPSADAEKWRERRRAERAAKQALAADADDEPAVAVVADVVEKAQPEPTPVEAVAAGPTSRRREPGRAACAGSDGGAVDGAQPHPASLDHRRASSTQPILTNRPNLEPAEPPEE